MAGTGTRGDSGDGGPATNARLWNPSALAVDANAYLYIADSDSYRVRKVGVDGKITTVAGTGVSGVWSGGRDWGDGGPATKAPLGYPSGLAVDSKGNLYVADKSNGGIRKVSADGTITSIAE